MRYYCIIRSSNERTLKNLIRDAILVFGEENVRVLDINPFFKAFEECLKIGTQIQCEWIVCLDGDLTIDTTRLKKLLGSLPKKDKKTYGFQPYFFDKFFMSPRTGGIHIYNRDLCQTALGFYSKLPTSKLDRPEGTLINTMRINDYHYKLINQLVCLHDFDQNYEDIYRKAYFHRFKSEAFLGEILKSIRTHRKIDQDYDYISKGICDAMQTDGFVYGENQISLPMNFPKKETEFLSKQQVEEILQLGDKMLADTYNSSSLYQKIKRYISQVKNRH